MRQIIERQVAQIARLVAGLADVSRAHAGELRLAWRRVDLAAVVEAAVAGDASLPGQADR